MATPRKKWPHEADWARCDSIGLARKGRAALLEVLEHIDNPVVLHRLTRAVEAFREIESKLVMVGPRTEAPATDSPLQVRRNGLAGSE